MRAKESDALETNPSYRSIQQTVQQMRQAQYLLHQKIQWARIGAVVLFGGTCLAFLLTRHIWLFTLPACALMLCTAVVFFADTYGRAEIIRRVNHENGWHIPKEANDFVLKRLLVPAQVSTEKRQQLESDGQTRAILNDVAAQGRPLLNLDLYTLEQVKATQTKSQTQSRT